MAQTQGLRAQGVAWIVPLLFSVEIPTAFLERGVVVVRLEWGKIQGSQRFLGCCHHIAPWLTTIFHLGMFPEILEFIWG
jgi:hypothetical protein